MNNCWLFEGAGFSSSVVISVQNQTKVYIEIFGSNGEIINTIELDVSTSLKIPGSYLISEQILKAGIKSSLICIRSDNQIKVRTEYYFNDKIFSVSDLEDIRIQNKFYPINLNVTACFLFLGNMNDSEIKVSFKIIHAKTSVEHSVYIKPRSNEILDLTKIFEEQSIISDKAYLYVKSDSPYLLQLLESSEKAYSEFYSMMG